MNRTQTVAFWFLIIAVIALSVYVLWWTKTEGFSCINNSPVYAVQMLEKANEAPVECLCSTRKREKSATVLLDREGFHSLESKNAVGDKEVFNFTLPVANG